MMSFEKWLKVKQKVTREWFLTMIPDKKEYYKKYDEYRCRAARFNAEVTKRECEQVAEEIIALG